MVNRRAPVGGTMAVAAAIAGNTLEWFDFTVFNLFSIYIAKAFFPAESDLASLLLALATYGVGFVLRPVGAIVLGQYADRVGRRAALTLIIFLMLIGTAIIAFTPTYAQIGPLAPALIVLARLIQGFSVGGEMGGATAYLIETAPASRRGLYASWQYAGQAGAALGGSLLVAALSHRLGHTALYDWAGGSRSFSACRSPRSDSIFALTSRNRPPFSPLGRHRAGRPWPCCGATIAPPWSGRSA